jgi:hypothetical protein
MLERFRGLSATMLGPVARLLIKLGVSPDVVTITGTLGVVLAALICFPQGWLWQGVLIVIVFVISGSGRLMSRPEPRVWDLSVRVVWQRGQTGW